MFQEKYSKTLSMSPAILSNGATDSIRTCFEIGFRHSKGAMGGLSALVFGRVCGRHWLTSDSTELVEVSQWHPFQNTL